MLKDVLGRTVQMTITDENDKFVFGQIDGLTFKLDKSELIKIPKMGAVVSGFAYENEYHELQLTKDIPEVGVDRYSWGTVVKVQRNLGVFVNIGLKNKDVVVSLDDLPTINSLWPDVGDKLMIALKIDDKNRIWGTLATDTMMIGVSDRANKKMMNKNVVATAYRLKIVGTYVITDEYYLGFIHPSEREYEPRLGERVNARVIGVRDDGVLNLSLKPRAFEAIGDDAQMILELLKRQSTPELPFTDKSSPGEIKSYFGISKGAFKRAVGHLLKAGVVHQENGRLILN